jgi:hypothetical protein
MRGVQMDEVPQHPRPARLEWILRAIVATGGIGAPAFYVFCDYQIRTVCASLIDIDIGAGKACLGRYALRSLFGMIVAALVIGLVMLFGWKRLGRIERAIGILFFTLMGMGLLAAELLT